MTYMALYRKWRPSVFEDVVEQEHVVRTLRNTVTKGRIAHAYLFCGTRGTGKTTMAHILSRAINCLNPDKGDPCNKCEICTEILSGSSMDVLEIDAASNNSVDNVREIREEVIYTPSRARYKVYIIDEVHMLSTGAFNALLKTLEEPPAHVVFILATTEPHKLPATILSRCQRFDFRRITIDSIVGRLTEITSESGIVLENDAARLIARMADGALRDAISLLDQCISLGRESITYKDVLSVIGIVNDTFIAALADDVLNKDVGSILEKVGQLIMDGKDIAHFISDLVHYFRNLLICKIAANPSEVMDMPAEVINVMKEQSAKTSQEEAINIIKELSSLESGLKWVTNPRIMLEVTLVKLCESSPVSKENSIIERLEALERKMSGAIIKPPVQINEKHEADQSLITGAASRKPAIKTAPAISAAADSAKADYMTEWQNILDELKSMGRMSLHSFLMDTKAVRLKENLVGVIFNERNKFGKTVVSKAENMEVLEETAGKVLRLQVKLKCIDEEALGNLQQKKQCEIKDDFMEKARSIAEKAGVPLDIIEE